MGAHGFAGSGPRLIVSVTLAGKNTMVGGVQQSSLLPSQQLGRKKEKEETRISEPILKPQASVP